MQKAIVCTNKTRKMHIGEGDCAYWKYDALLGGQLPGLSLVLGLKRYPPVAQKNALLRGMPDNLSST